MKNSVITLFEDRKTSLSINHEQINDLMYMRGLLGKQNLRMDYDGSIQIMHYVGFIAKGNTSVQILPKIYEKIGITEEDEIKESVKVLYNLLRYSSYNKVLQLPEKINSSLLEQDFMEIFIQIFAEKVFQTYSTRMHKEYVEIEENSAFIRGKIKFPETIKHNLFRRDLHYIGYQSFEQENTINNVMKTVVLRLLGNTKNKNSKVKLKKALLFLEDAKKIEISLPLLDSVKFTRLNMDFKSVYRMARMFFLNLQPQNYEGEESVFSFLIPVNDLFEHYLYKIFSEFQEYEVVYQHQKKFAFTEEGTSLLTVKPDIMIRKNKNTILIVDAKYKNPGFENGSYGNIKSTDMYQIYAYSKIYGVKTVVLVYPSFNKVQPPSKKIILKYFDGEVEVVIVSVDLINESIDMTIKKLSLTLGL